MIKLATALTVLVLTHLVLSATGVRQACIRVLGLAGFRLLYSIASVGVTAWLNAAYIETADAPWLWLPSEWGRWAAVAGMPAAIWLVAVRLFNRPNKMRSGFYRVILVPRSSGLLLWALLYLLNVGHARARMLFGAFTAISAVAAVKNALIAPPTAGPNAGGADWDWRPAVAAWVLLLGAHPYVIGLDPLAGILT